MPTGCPSDPVRRVVVGAGMSGLAYAWGCARNGDDVSLIEAEDRVGGVIRTQQIGSYRVERAATSIPSGAAYLRALLDSLPRSPSLIEASAASKQFILRRDGLEPVPRSPASLARSRVLRPRSALRALGEVLRGPRRGARSESLYAFVQRRFGRAVADGFLRPFTTGVYGAAPERLGAADAFPVLAAYERRRGSVIKALASARRGRTTGPRRVLVAADGTESIPLAIAEALGDRVRLDSRVAGVTPGTSDDRPTLHLQDGGRVTADEIVLALPASAQASLLAETHPPVAETLAAIAYAPIAVVAVGWRRERGPAVPSGFGFLRGPGSRARILGATFNARLNPAVAPDDASLLTAFVGGSEDPGAVELTDDALRDVVLRDLRTALGGSLRPDLFDVWRWPRAIPMPSPGHRGRMARLAAALSGSRLRLLGSHVTGVSLNDCCRPGMPLPRPVPAGLRHV